MNNNKKKITTVVLLLAFLAIAVTGGTLAYFTDTKEATNTFAMGNVKITLDETDVDDSTPDTDRDATNTYSNIYPGQVVIKDPVVHNVGSNAAYVRVKVTVSNGKFIMPLYDENTHNGSTTSDDSFKYLTHNTFDDNWEYVNAREVGNDVEYTLNYKTILAASTDSTPVFDEIYFPTWITNDDVINKFGPSFNINVVAEAIQADGFVAEGGKTAMENAWIAFDTP